MHKLAASNAAKDGNKTVHPCSSFIKFLISSERKQFFNFLNFFSSGSCRRYAFILFLIFVAYFSQKKSQKFKVCFIFLIIWAWDTYKKVYKKVWFSSRKWPCHSEIIRESSKEVHSSPMQARLRRIWIRCLWNGSGQYNNMGKGRSSAGTENSKIVSRRLPK